MAIVVEHDKRKQEILQKSLDVFIEEGYEDATFQKIADRCGITRTTLYIYFKNKHEIFLGSIKELLAELEISLKKIMNTSSLNAELSLRKVLSTLADSIESNKKLFSVLLNYLMQLKKSGVDTNERVLRRVIRLRHLLSTILIKGIQSKEFKEINVKDINDTLYGLLESAIFRIAVLNKDDVADVRAALNTTVDLFKA
ncbi:MAG: TetR/AcrR family transcriptional regulator [Treponema sp.]|nr:TetR/AcrR family transcriptional regulator [Treponema sp.]MCI6592149.1 TetR/AcrR family transcriptional regulator [Spirochaetia bacterium]MDD7534407.1 TetR/AcrR family transcriptional regulator [Treponema sp.]MDY3721630.1 TetR/AcrR family transcriptional regulator [Treponema sp.]MDY5758243.1 TetR/AcrR family transcriptional regulator [Treponema sp.]